MKLIATVIAASVTGVTAWGAAGHQITATIAQILLTDHTHDQLCHILPDWSKCHLAPVAAWADQIKRFPEWRSWTSAMHYVNPLGDWPSKHCDFGGSGWHSPEKNLITAINNYTHLVAESEGQDQDYALRFLVHYLGDIHQPLHLTGRERGGNGIKVRFEHRLTNLHSVWDEGFITKAVREMKNYTHPVPEKRIERALRGSIYDSYVRWIAKEGLLGWWKDEYPTWSLCPTEPLVIGGSRDPQTFLRGHSSSGVNAGRPLGDDPDLPVCPLHWSSALHPMNCDFIFPPELDTPEPGHRSWFSRLAMAVKNWDVTELMMIPDYLELNTPQYAGQIRDHKVVEKMLAMGGVRLAAVLNDIFDPREDGVQRIVQW